MGKRLEPWSEPVIEKGVPLPQGIRYCSGRRRSTTPWDGFLDKLAPGDSFVVRRYQTQALLTNAKRRGMRLTWVTESEDRVRVWLVPQELTPTRPKRLWLKDQKKQVAFPKPEPSTIGLWEKDKDFVPGSAGDVLDRRLREMNDPGTLDVSLL